MLACEKLKRPKKPKTTGKEGAKDCPSWAKENGGPMHNESGKDYAKRLLDEKYGPDGTRWLDRKVARVGIQQDSEMGR